MGILSWILFGLIAGALGKIVMPGEDPRGWLITIGLGVLGAFVGGTIGAAVGFGGVEDFGIRSFLVAIFGTVVVLTAYRMFLRKKAEPDQVVSS